MPKTRRSQRRQRAAPSDRAPIPWSAGPLNPSGESLPIYLFLLWTRTGNRRRDLGEKQLRLLSFCYRWLRPQAQRHLTAVLEECKVLPEWKHSELIRRKLSGPVPSGQGRTLKPVATPWIQMAYAMLKSCYKQSGPNAVAIRHCLQSHRECLLPDMRTAVDLGLPRSVLTCDSMDLLLKQNLKEIAEWRPSPSDFAGAVLASALGQDPASVKQQIKRARRRLRKGRLV